MHIKGMVRRAVVSPYEVSQPIRSIVLLVSVEGPSVTGQFPLLAQPGPTGMSAFVPLLGDKRTSILPHLTASVCSAFPFTSRA